jgi:ectoine hydroxylase-related dioxygenase (phytanoyl-CoA dioxygenase family)
MRVIPGSHKQGLVSHAAACDESNMLFRGETVAGVDESSAEDVVLQPGEMSMHDSNIVHGSNPNTSDEPRVGFIVRFVTSRVRNRERPLLRARGEGDCGHLTLARPPSAKDQRAAAAAWRKANGL